MSPHHIVRAAPGLRILHLRSHRALTGWSRMPGMTIIREGTEADAAAVLALLDGGVRWLADRGRTGQWGSEPMSANPRMLDKFAGMAATPGRLWLAGDEPAGALIVGETPSYAQPVTEPELYINWLITDRARAGEGIGARLLAHARELAAAAGKGLLRVDCYAGDDRGLVHYYERQGFTPTKQFTVGDWPGQILEQRLNRT
jgi:GNAT superfamily N-acetyltransferase